MSDLIDRKLAKDAIHKKLDGSSFDGDLWHVADDIDDILDELPSASTELSNNSPKLDNKNGDLISRQDAIKYFAELWECIEAIGDREEWEDVCVTTANEIKSAQSERVWTPCDIPPEHHRDVIVRGIEAIGGERVYKVMQWDVDTWRPKNYAPSITWLDWSEI